MGNDFELGDINIGCADGEKEAMSSQFLDLFYTENDKYQEIMLKEKFIISGRKGTGKTILSKYVEHKNHKDDTVVQYIKLNEMSLHEYIDIEKSEINVDDRILFQSYYLYKQIAYAICINKIDIMNFIKNKSKIRGIREYLKYKKAYKELNDFYNTQYINGSFKGQELIEINKFMSLCEATGGNNQAKVTGKQEDEHTLQCVKIRTSFIERYENLSKLVHGCVALMRVILIIDDLDETNIEDKKHRNNFLIQFLIKINEINCNKFFLEHESKCIVLLRNDILDSFGPYNSNVQKILTVSRVDLNWFQDVSKNQLFKLVAHKIKRSCPYFAEKSDKEISSILFPKSKEGYFPFEEIVRYSFGRPRDIITFLSIIISENKKEKEFNIASIKSAKLRYSENMLGEVQNEMNVHWSPEEIEDAFSLLQDYGRTTFLLTEIKKYYRENLTAYPNIVMEIEDVFVYFYELGVVGTYRKRNGKTKHNWSYRGNGTSTPNFTDRISVHFSLRKKLNLN